MIRNLPSKGHKGFVAIPILSRFYEKVRKAESCWEWEAAINSSGYGQIKYNGSMKLAHRVSYELEMGCIPRGKYVLHKCDNPRCVKVDHLYIGTQQDNMNDMVLRKRGNPGGRLYWRLRND